jgi:hypothetical protein
MCISNNQGAYWSVWITKSSIFLLFATLHAVSNGFSFPRHKMSPVFFVDTKCHTSSFWTQNVTCLLPGHKMSPVILHYWCLGSVKDFVCVQGLVLIHLAVLFTPRKGNLHLFLWLNVDFWKARVQVPVIPDLGTRWRWVARFTLWTADVSCGHLCYSGPRSEQNTHWLCSMSKLKPSSL